MTPFSSSLKALKVLIVLYESGISQFLISIHGSIQFYTALMI